MAALLPLLPSPTKHPLLFTTTPTTSAARIKAGGRLRLLLHRRRISSAATPTTIIASTSAAAAAAAEAAAEPAVEQPPRTRLIAQNIPWDCTAEDIRRLFEKHGNVTDVELSMYNSSRNRGLAFLTMASEEEALAALSNLNSYDLNGRIIKVEFARSLKKSSPAAEVPGQKYNVFVGNLAWRVRSKDLRELFDASWNVLSAEVIFQTNPRRSAGYGFVSFASKEEAESAISTFNGKKLMGRALRMFLGKQNDDAEGKSYGGEQSDV